MPDLLRCLLDDSTADEAIGCLFGNIWHQSTIYEATSQAVPFLIEIFAIDSPVRDEIGFLLRSIADGLSYLATHRPVRNEPANESEQLDQREAAKRLWVADGCHAVAAGLDVYLNVFRSTSTSPVRASAAYVVGGCRERASEAIDGLLELAREEDPEVGSALLLAIDDLLAHTSSDDQAVSLFTEIATSATDARMCGIRVARPDRRDRRAVGAHHTAPPDSPRRGGTPTRQVADHGGPRRC